MVKLRRKVTKLFMLILASLFMLVGCETLKNTMPWEQVDYKLENYAEARYRKAIRYMEESRFELAQEQFAIVAATANSEKLRKLGLDGYSRADKAIGIKR